jgi:uncharacterized protein (DUF1684 family)
MNDSSAGSIEVHPAPEYQAWREARWQDITGPTGKAAVIGNGLVTGRETVSLPAVPGRWGIDASGALIVTAAPEDGVTVDGKTVDGTAQVSVGCSLDFSGGRRGVVGGTPGNYSMVFFGADAVAASGITGIETYPYDPQWVVQGRYRPAEPGRRIEVGRLTTPRTMDVIPAPGDLVVSIGETEYVLAVLEASPGLRLAIFTDETSGTETPDIGRWLVLPMLAADARLAIDFNQAVLSYHHVNPGIFFCPMRPPGNHLPLRISAGERALIRDPK